MKTSRKPHTHRPQTTHLITRQNTEKTTAKLMYALIVLAKMPKHRKNTGKSACFHRDPFQTTKQKTKEKTTSTSPRESR